MQNILAKHVVRVRLFSTYLSAWYKKCLLKAQKLLVKIEPDFLTISGDNKASQVVPIDRYRLSTRPLESY